MLLERCKRRQNAKSDYIDQRGLLLQSSESSQLTLAELDLWLSGIFHHHSNLFWYLTMNVGS